MMIGWSQFRVGSNLKNFQTSNTFFTNIEPLEYLNPDFEPVMDQTEYTEAFVR